MRGFITYRPVSPGRLVFFGTSAGEIGEVVVQPRYYAFSVSPSGDAQVFDYPVDEDGVEAVSNLTRAESVIAVVLGELVPVVEESVVHIGAGRNRHQHRLTTRQ